MWRGPGRHRAAAARQRGRPRRGRDPLRRRRRAGDGRRPPAGGPRAARRRRRGDQPAHGRGAGRRRRPRLPRRHRPRRALLRALPVDHRGVPRDRHRPGARPHPGRAGRPLRVRRRAGAPRRHDGAARPVRRRRGRVHRRARRQPAGVEQPDRGRRRRDPARARPRLGAARPRRARRRCRRRRRRSTALTGPTCGRRCRATSAWSATPRRWRPRRTCSTPSPARSTPPAPPTRAAWEATNVLTVASAVVAAATARTESRGCHRRTDFPEPRDEWRRHLDVGLADDGRRGGAADGRRSIRCPTTPVAACSPAASTPTPSPRSCGWPSPRT